MNLRTFGQTVLYETRLTAKLTVAPAQDPGSQLFADDGPGPPVSAPNAPGRPAGLELRPRGTTGSLKFPAAKSLADAKNRGVVLHFFANHELLAMELMALALLRFPDAPAAFRQGVARTLVEEQRHLQMYMGRMAELGVEFGSLPVNRFFWDCIAAMRTPLDYVTQMSLTLEQANLDFSRHFRDLFRKLGDEATAALLDVVYRDEIGHVKHGVAWFNRWRPGHHDDWDEYRQLLAPPLSPIRAKGLGYDREARHSAGLSERFVSELAVYRHSKGRPPVVYWFNPACEAEIASRASAFNPPLALCQIAADLASLMQFLTRADDVVWVHRRPTTGFLTRLQAAGLPVPQFIENPKELSGRPIAALEPWGQSPTAQRREADLQLKRLQPKRLVKDWRVYSKAFSAELLRAIAPSEHVGRVFRETNAARASIAEHFAGSSTPLVLKAPFGASGRDMMRVKAPGLEVRQERWLEKTIDGQGEVVVEPWLDRTLDLSVQINVANGKRPILGVTRFLTDGRGQYLGHKLGQKFADQPAEVRRALYARGGFLGTLEHIGKLVRQSLSDAGYVGPAGIDALVYHQGDQFALKPIVEINPRYTMGRIALELDRHVYHAVEAEWLHLSLKRVQSLGYPDFVAFAAVGERQFPPKRLSGTSGPLMSGFVATNDPETAQRFLTVLVVGEARSMARRQGCSRSLPQT